MSNKHINLKSKPQPQTESLWWQPLDFPSAIAITGPSLVGKNETLRQLGLAMPGYRTEDCSDIFRAFAAEKDFYGQGDFEGFVTYVSSRPNLSQDCDAAMEAQTAARLRAGKIFLAGRLPHYVAAAEKICAFRVSLVADINERRKRAGARRIDPDKVLGRDQADARRYAARYGVTLPPRIGTGLFDVDLVVSTEFFNPAEVARIICESASCWQRGVEFVADRSQPPT